MQGPFHTFKLAEKYWDCRDIWWFIRMVGLPLHVIGQMPQFSNYRKIPKMSPGAYIVKGPFWGAYIWRGLLSTKGNLRFKIDWARLIVGSKFTIFVLVYFVFEGNFPSTSPRGAYIWRGLYMEGLIFGILWYLD